ncbi:hypothetical protein GCM10010434_073440 [Winogradskya humida]
MRAPVQFERAVRVLAELGHELFVEVTPHPVLLGAVGDIVEDGAVFGTLRRDDGGVTRLVTSFAEAFVRGAGVDWTRVLPAADRVELPTYAFRHQRYWPDAVPVVAAPGTDRTGSPAEAEFWAAVENGDLGHLAETLALPDGQHLGEVLPALASWRRQEQDRSVTTSWRYRVNWAPVSDPDPGVLSGHWLVVTGPAGLTQARDAERALAARGADVTLIEVPAEVTDRTELGAVLAPAVAEAGAIAGVLSLLALDETPLPEHPVVVTGLAATLALVQALGDTGVDAPLWVATSGAVAAGPGEVLTSPVQAEVWGFGRVASFEYPDRWGGLLDVPAELDDRAGARLVAVLAGCGEQEVAIRATGLYGRRMVHAPQPRTGPGWTPRGTVLITGGTGAIGGHVARRLAGDGAQRLVLTSRSGPGAADVAALAAGLATTGARVDVVGCDAGRRDHLAGLLDWVAADGPAVSSVMHTAGVLDDGVVDRQSPSRLATVLAAKVASAALLDELTAGLDLDAFVLFSSAASTLGSAGQSNYAAANAYLDALAENRRARGLAALAVAWGLWGGGGLADSKDAIRNRMQRMPMPAMDPILAVQALFEALQSSDTALTVMDVNWTELLAASGAADLRSRPFVRDLPEIRQLAAVPAIAGDAAPDEGELIRRLSGLPAGEQERVLTDIVRAEAAVVLGHSSADEVQAKQAFKDLGFDSLSGVELRNRLNAATGLRLPATLVFDYPTPMAIAAWLRTEIAPSESAGVPVLDELDRLEASLAALRPDPATHEDVTSRLRTILSKWIEDEDGAASEKEAVELESATPDQLFDFLDKELGLSS